MKILIFAVFIICGITQCYGFPYENAEFKSLLSDIQPSRGIPWPYPQQYASEATFFTLDPTTFEFSLVSQCDILLDAVQRYKKLTFIDQCNKPSKTFKKRVKEYPGSKGQLSSLKLQYSGTCEKYPYMNMDEQYLIKIDTPDAQNQALLFSTTVWGLLRGLETFSQMVYQLEPGLFAINTSIVLDFPRFSFRGILLDTSRHFVPVPILLQNLDAMAQTKMNVFHWHIVDDQSFPYVSKKFPDLSKKGAFSETHVYTQSDIANVIEHARLRGIRVLAEFDTPGHTLSWGKSQSSLLTKCYNNSEKYGPIDPTQSKNFMFLNEFFGEIAQVFPDNYVHLGGDEVSFECWKSNPNINNFMKKMGFGDNYALLEEFYVQKLLDMVKSYKKSYIVWQEVFDNGVQVNPDTVIHVWKDGYQSEMANVTSSGLNAILSSCWYLNYINYGPDWVPYYLCDPHNFTGSAKQKELVIGGEACMWGEFVDGSNVITRTWPRAALVAERLWSNQSVTSAAKAIPRVEELRCAMIKRGLKVEPINGPGYCECDYLP